MYMYIHDSLSLPLSSLTCRLSVCRRLHKQSVGVLLHWDPRYYDPWLQQDLGRGRSRKGEERGKERRTNGKGEWREQKATIKDYLCIHVLTKLFTDWFQYSHFILLVQHCTNCALDSFWYLINILRFYTCLERQRDRKTERVHTLNAKQVVTHFESHSNNANHSTVPLNRTPQFWWSSSVTLSHENESVSLAN